MGISDNTIIEWKVDFLINIEEENLKIDNIKDEENYIKDMLRLERKLYHFL